MTADRCTLVVFGGAQPDAAYHWCQEPPADPADLDGDVRLLQALAAASPGGEPDVVVFERLPGDLPADVSAVIAEESLPLGTPRHNDVGGRCPRRGQRRRRHRALRARGRHGVRRADVVRRRGRGPSNGGRNPGRRAGASPAGAGAARQPRGGSRNCARVSTTMPRIAVRRMSPSRASSRSSATARRCGWRSACCRRSRRPTARCCCSAKPARGRSSSPGRCTRAARVIITQSFR